MRCCNFVDYAYGDKKLKEYVIKIKEMNRYHSLFIMENQKKKEMVYQPKMNSEVD